MAGEHDLVKRNQILMLLNRQEPNGDVAPLRTDVTPRLIGTVPADAELAAFDRLEQSLLELPHDNPAAHAIWHACARMMEG